MRVFTVVKRNAVIVALALASAAVLVFISEASYWKSVDTLDELGGMATARTAIRELERSILDAETGQRGFLLTDRTEYLQPYDRAVAEIEVSFALLDRYFADQPTAQVLLDKLRRLTDAKLSELGLTIRLHRLGKGENTRDIMLSDIGKEQMEGIRALSAELLALETQRVAAAREDIYSTLMLSRVGIAALSGIVLLALYLYLRQSLALKQQQRELQRALQIERDRLDIEVKQRTAQLTELTHHLLTAREDERNRLARNLHDELGALLTSAKLDAARIRSRLAGIAPEALERLAHLVETLNSSIALGRRIIEDLRPSTFANLGLAQTLEILARDFASASGLQVHCQLQPVVLEPKVELVVYRVVQEAITNISKYARASQVWITLAPQEGQAEVSVRDDGIGFDTTARRSSTHGLAGMRVRVEAEGGTLTVVSAPQQGTLIQVRLPQSALATA